MAESYFKKGDLIPSWKLNTRIENQFYHFKIHSWLVIQKYNFSKIIII